MLVAKRQIDENKKIEEEERRENKLGCRIYVLCMQLLCEIYAKRITVALAASAAWPAYAAVANDNRDNNERKYILNSFGMYILWQSFKLLVELEMVISFTSFGRATPTLSLCVLVCLCRTRR